MTQTFTTDDNFTAISSCTVSGGSVTADTGFENATLDALAGDLIHGWHFDESSGNATDSKGSLDLTNTNSVTYTTGKSGNAAEFTPDGASSPYFYAASRACRNLSKFMISCWFYYDDASSGTIFYETYNTANNNDYSIWLTTIASDKMRFVAGGVILDSSGVVSEGAWHHALISYNSLDNQIYMYLDGILAASSTSSISAMTDTAGYLSVGKALYGGGGYFLNGLIDELYIWDDVPSDAGDFASALYNSGSGRFWLGETGDGQFTVHDAGADNIDAGSGYTQDFSEFANTLTGSPAITYQYYQSNNSGDTPTYNGTWLTLAQLQAVTDTALRYIWLKVRIVGTASDSFDELTGDIGSTDLTPPSDVTSIASSIHGTGPYDLVAFFTGGTDTGGSGYAGANLEIEVGGVSYFQQSDGTFGTSETFADLLLKGDAATRDIIYAIQYASLPTRFRLNVWDNAENYNRGDWDTFSNPATTTPGAPAITTATAGGGSVTLTLTAAEETDLIYARYRTPDSGWSSESGTFSRTGSGEIEVTGLTNSTIYYFSAYAKSGSLTSDWSPAAHAVPGLSTGAVIGDIAQAVTDYLNATALSLPFTAERTYLPLFDRKDMDSLHVTVVPVEIAEDSITRGQASLRVKVDVCIQQAVDAEDTAAVDGLVAFALEVATTLRGADLADADAQWVEQSHEPAYDLDGLREHRQFTSLITATYVTYKEAA